jgi:hypothetical protein
MLMTLRVVIGDSALFFAFMGSTFGQLFRVTTLVNPIAVE